MVNDWYSQTESRFTCRYEKGEHKLHSHTTRHSHLLNNQLRVLRTSVVSVKRCNISTNIKADRKPWEEKWAYPTGHLKEHPKDSPKE